MWRTMASKVHSFLALLWNICALPFTLLRTIFALASSSRKHKETTQLWQTPLRLNDNNVQPITVIIPALNEAATLYKTLSHLFSTCSLPTTLGCGEPAVIVVDGNSQDGTHSSILPLLSSHSSLQFLSHALPSRGAQQNLGARHAASPILLFLHADTLLPTGWDAIILSTLSSRVAPAIGSFSLSLPNPVSPQLRVMLFGASVRARYGGLPYGDQAFFIRSETFEAVGGFPDVPIMEDVELLRRVRQIGGDVRVLEDAVVTSPRRWLKKGVLWNTLLNQLLILAWLCGVGPRTIYVWYYGATPRARVKGS